MTSLPPSEEFPTGDLHSYSGSLSNATLALEEVVHTHIRQNGAMSFPAFMDIALYHSTLGYYTKGHTRVGKNGDFFTSVSVGSAFGAILAHRIHKEWLHQDKPKVFHIIEMGANNGQLANDILEELHITFPLLYEIALYHIVEPLQVLKDVQLKTTNAHRNKIQQHDTLDELQNLNGVFLSNELIDAFPVHIIQLTESGWKEKMISIKDENNAETSLQWQLSDLSSQELTDFSKTLSSYPLGYTTEYRPNLGNFTRAVANSLSNGLILTIDYGYTAENYYHPSRSSGTLRTYKNHTTDDTPLSDIGGQDITAHVDFTQLAKAYTEAGFHTLDFIQQSRYLTTHGKEWLIALENEQDLSISTKIRQFQTLIHPSMLGSRFFALEMSTTVCDNEVSTRESLGW